MREIESDRQKKESLLSLQSIFKKEIKTLNTYFERKWEEFLASILFHLKKKSLDYENENKSIQSLSSLNSRNFIEKRQEALSKEMDRLKVLSRAPYKMSQEKEEQEKRKIHERTERVFKEDFTYLPKPGSYLKYIPIPLQDLLRSMHYSLFSKGQRFRPLLALLVAKSLKVPVERVLPFAFVLEMVHTYSLIHDDLPCMDDAVQRRGLLSNHRVFGEALSLLSGTALLTEAFSLLSVSYAEDSYLVVELTRKLSKVLGPLGVMGGQSMDMAMRKAEKPEGNPSSLKWKVYFEELEELSIRKTGSLLQYALFGSGLICGVSLDVQEDLDSYAVYLGLAFQLADDILDFKVNVLAGEKKTKEPSEKGEEPSFVDFLGEKKSKDLLDTWTEEAISFIPGSEFKALKKMALYNRRRIRSRQK